VRKILSAVLVLVVSGGVTFADAATWQVKVPDQKGRQLKATLTFNDANNIIDIRTAKGDAVQIPYAEIDKCSYEFTKQHHAAPGTTSMMASAGTGAIVMLTRSKSHWLEIDYHEQEVPKVFVLRMDKREYLNILDALKAHTGKDPEILGNAKKR
jgi:hypothetical protein